VEKRAKRSNPTMKIVAKNISKVAISRTCGIASGLHQFKIKNEKLKIDGIVKSP